MSKRRKVTGADVRTESYVFACRYPAGVVTTSVPREMTELVLLTESGRIKQRVTMCGPRTVIGERHGEACAGRGWPNPPCPAGARYCGGRCSTSSLEIS